MSRKESRISPDQQQKFFPNAQSPFFGGISKSYWKFTWGKFPGGVT